MLLISSVCARELGSLLLICDAIHVNYGDFSSFEK